MDHTIPALQQRQHQEIENSISTEIEPKITESLPEINEKEKNRLGDSEETERGGDDPSEVSTLLNKDYQSEDRALTTSIKSLTEVNAKEDENCDEENLGKDSVRVMSNILDKSNGNAAYKDQIKRLNLDIVKNVADDTLNTNVNEDSRKENVVDEFYFLPGEPQANEELHYVNNAENLEGKKIDSKKNETNINREIPKWNSKEPLDSENNTVHDDFVCGFGSFKPSWLQEYATPKVYLTLFSIMGVIQGCYFTYFGSIITTLEKRYGFQTKITGSFSLAGELTSVLFGAIVGYIGSKTHRPRMIALGMIVSCTSSFLSGLPYLIYGSGKHFSAIKYTNETGPELCDVDMKSKGCDAEDVETSFMAVVVIFFAANFLKGFASLAFNIVGISYMDDNIKTKNSPLYLAIATTLRLFGPLLGYLTSSIFLNYYENPFVDPGYGPHDPRWVGAWWIGFFLQGALLTTVTIPIALFPKRLPGQRSVNPNINHSSKMEWKQMLPDLTSAFKRLGKNPVFIIQTINTIMKIFGQFGHSFMLPKYMENQFRLSASEASLYSGASSITMVLVSTMLGGFVMWKFQPRIKVLLCGMAISQILMSIGFLLLTIPRCQPVDLVNSGTNNEGLMLTSLCNEQCDCSTTSFTPYCGQDGKTYFSPCYAGCTQEKNSSKTQKEFGNCSCMATTEDTQFVLTISEGFCPDEKCWSQTLAYVIVLLIIVSLSNGFNVLDAMILLRCVPPKDKSFGIGTFESLVCLLGFIPFPITMGALVDFSCLVWKESCGETGNCWFYDMDKFNYLLHGMSAIFCFCSVLCVIVLYLLSSGIRDLYADEEEEEEDYEDIKLDHL